MNCYLFQANGTCDRLNGREVQQLLLGEVYINVVSTYQQNGFLRGYITQIPYSNLFKTGKETTINDLGRGPEKIEQKNLKPLLREKKLGRPLPYNNIGKK